MIWWAAQAGFSAPYFCPARGEEPAGYKVLVAGGPGDDAHLVGELRELLIAANVEQFDLAAASRRSARRERQALLTWRSSDDAERALGAFEVSRRLRGVVVFAAYWIPQRYDPWDHDPCFVPRRADPEELDVEPEHA